MVETKVSKDKSEGDILAIKARDQYKTVDELMKKSESNSVYYTLLVLSSSIIAFGLLLNNSAVVIGGMLVTPVLTPVLFISLGIVINEIDLVKRVGMLLVKSFLIIGGAGYLSSLVFGASEMPILFENSMRTAALYFMVALGAGIAAGFAWTRKDVVDALPGVAIAVALVPPVTMVGIGLFLFNFELVRFYLFAFLFNIFGVIVGGLIVFSLLDFYKTKNKVHKEVEESVKEEEKAKAKKKK